jgi:hypothetical protein
VKAPVKYPAEDGGADVRSAPPGGLLPPSEAGGLWVAPPAGSIRKIRARRSQDRRRVSRFNERAAIYALLVERAGMILTHADVAAALGMARDLATDCVNSMWDHPDDYPHLDRPARGTIRYTGPAVVLPPLPDARFDPPREDPLVAPGGPFGSGGPLPPVPAPAAPTGDAWTPGDEMILAVARPVDGGWLVLDEDTGCTYVLRRATAADLKGMT